MSETSYLNKIERLVELQKVDDAIFEVKKALDNAPRELVDLRKRFEEVEARRDRALDKLSHMEDQRKRLAHEMAEDDSRMKKSRDKMTQIGNEREHQAVLREMDSLERVGRIREEERDTLQEELRLASMAVDEINGEYDEIKAELDAKTESLEETQALARDRVAVLESQRRQASEHIDKPIFMRYEFIRKRLDNPVIVAVADGVCSGCHITVPPQTYIDLQRGQQILSCPNCQRLIFWSEHFEEPAPAGAEATSPRAEPDVSDEETESQE